MQSVIFTLYTEGKAKGPFKRFQHLFQHAFNTLLNQMLGAFEQVIQHCWRRVESNLNPFKLSFNIHKTFHLFSKMLNGVEAVWTLRTFVKHLPNIRPTFVERMLVKWWNRLYGS